MVSVLGAVRVGIALLALSVICTAVAVGTNGWRCGYLFKDSCTSNEQTIAVLGLLGSGAACVFIVFVMDCFALRTLSALESPSFVTFRTLLICLGFGAQLAGVLLYLIQYTMQDWSHFLATCGAMLAANGVLMAFVTCNAVSCSC
ncbi:hypothetical protein CRM22_007717 [Opisthorchis felineus]|uniref:MARVEL domain-containing protein n=1 Tax=Opisthorchis felineus TaxID=147828 RepID=A0A4S2LEJ2_OPIFE|nr:hypothetical protein CRM22_007717 [Opisthorchis felineus]